MDALEETMATKPEPEDDLPDYLRPDFRLSDDTERKLAENYPDERQREAARYLIAMGGSDPNAEYPPKKRRPEPSPYWKRRYAQIERERKL